MNQKNLMIKKNDYEKYQIILPYRFLFGKRRRNYLSAELEKLHPCFSDEFSFDSDYRRLTRKGVSADVMVIHKYKLAEYETGHAVAGTGFLAEDCKHHRFFISEKIRLTVAAGVCLVVVIGLLGGISFGRFLKQSEIEVESDSLNQFISEDEEVSDFDDSAPVLGNQFFETVKNAGGEVSFLYWHTDGFRENLEAGISGVYPEVLEQIAAGENSGGKLLQTAYEKGVPTLQFSATRKIKNGVRANQKTEIHNKEEFCKALRSTLSSSGAVLKNENFSPYQITFSVDSNKSEQVFSDMAAVLNQFEKSVSVVKLEQQNEKLEAEVGVEENAFLSAVLNLELIAENTDIFKKRKQTESVTQSIAARAAVNTKLTSLEPEASKLGEIKDKTGRTIVFYKTSEGKIKKITEGNE